MKGRWKRKDSIIHQLIPGKSRRGVMVYYYSAGSLITEQNDINMKTALITGITGQDGSYLTELLISKGYKVHGLIRRASTFNTYRIDHIYVDLHDHDARLFLTMGTFQIQAKL